MFVVERFSSSRVGSSGDVIVVLELPVGPASEVELHEVSQYGDFLCTFGAVGESSKLSQKATCFQRVYVLLFGGHL